MQSYYGYIKYDWVILMHKAGKWLFGSLMFTLSLEEGLLPSFAACMSDEQCTVDDGQIEEINHKTLTVTSTTPQKTALLATNSGTIKGEALVIQTPSEADYYGGTASLSGVIRLNNSTIKAGRGLRAREAGSLIEMTGGTIDTTKEAIMLENGASIVLDHVDVKTQAYSGISTTAYSHDNTLSIINSKIEHTGEGNAISVSRGDAFLEGTHISSHKTGILLQGIGKDYIPGASEDATARLEMKNSSLETKGDNAYGVNINREGVAHLKDVSITTNGRNSNAIIIMSRQEKALEAENLTITTTGFNAHGILAFWGGSHLKNTDIHVDNAHGIYADGRNVDKVKGERLPIIHMVGGSLNVNGSNKNAAMAVSGAHIALDGVNITTKAGNNSGVSVYSDASIALKNSVVDIYGSVSQAVRLSGQSKADLINSKITIHDTSSYGVRFIGSAAKSLTVDRTTLQAKQSLAIFSSGAAATLNIGHNSHIEGDRLIFADDLKNGDNIEGSILTLNAHSSQLVGHAMVADKSSLSMNLEAGSLWKLRPTMQGGVHSHISSLNLEDSALFFDQNNTGLYQTLTIGSGELGGNRAVYHAKNNAAIHFNSLLNEGGALAAQKTDRLLIHGDVHGTTSLIIRPSEGSTGGLTSADSRYLNHEGISIIQVSGRAQENSFALPGGYVTMGGLPYQYGLYAYGPASVNGAADEQQRLVAGDNPHWDFRLQSQFVGSAKGKDPNINIREVAPQMASYLVAPRALFQAQMMDVSSLQRRLGSINSYPDDHFADDDDTLAKGGGAFFMRAYGGHFDYQSNLSRAQYGYDAHIAYSAMQAGGHFYHIETKNSATYFGVAGSYGDLHFKPRHRDAHPLPGNKKTGMKLWSIMPYATFQHNSGAYLDMIVSYGGFNGAVTTTARGRTAQLHGYSFAASMEAGLPLRLPRADLNVEPQAQFIYQKLGFDQTKDIDGFAVALGNPEQWTLRLGGKLQKSFGMTATDQNNHIYTKLHLTHSFQNKHEAWFGDNFTLSRAGNHLEMAVGGQASLGERAYLHGDVNWQQRIGHAGSTGFSGNVGLRISF